LPPIVYLFFEKNFAALPPRQENFLDPQTARQAIGRIG
jgi:hypothetical protein